MNDKMILPNTWLQSLSAICFVLTLCMRNELTSVTREFIIRNEESIVNKYVKYVNNNVFSYC